MDNEMIERVIKASFDCWNKKRELNYTVEDLSDDERIFAKEHAIAIIKAMREPTVKMMLVGEHQKLIEDSAGSIFMIMIDAVIND